MKVSRVLTGLALVSIVSTGACNGRKTRTKEVPVFTKEKVYVACASDDKTCNEEAAKLTELAGQHEQELAALKSEVETLQNDLNAAQDQIDERDQNISSLLASLNDPDVLNGKVLDTAELTMIQRLGDYESSTKALGVLNAKLQEIEIALGAKVQEAQGCVQKSPTSCAVVEEGKTEIEQQKLTLLAKVKLLSAARDANVKLLGSGYRAYSSILEVRADTRNARKISDEQLTKIRSIVN